VIRQFPIRLAASLALACATPARAQHVCAPDHGAHDDAAALRDAAAQRVDWSTGKPPKDPARVRLLGINDFHGQLPTGRKVGARPVGSAGVLAAWLKAAEAGVEDRTIIVHAGDHVGASPPASALLQDEPAVALLNLLANPWCHHLETGDLQVGGVDATAADAAFGPWMNPHCNVVGTVGNHEFDEGRAELFRLLGGGTHANGPFLEDPWRGARYPTLAANVVDAQTGLPILPPYVVKRVDGVPIGFIGLVLRQTPTIVTPTGVAGLEFLDEADTANRYVQELKDRGVRAIVVLIHQGGSQRSYVGSTSATGGEVTGPIVDVVKRLDDEVDVVVSGHTHQFTNALLPSAGGKPVLVTQAFSYSTAYARIDLEIDRTTGDVTAKSAAVQTTWADEGPGRTPDPDAAKLQAAADARVAPLVNRIVGTAAVAMPNAPNAAGESALGDLIADAQRAAVPDAQVAFMNPGGIRADLAAGPITWGALFGIQPFGNTVVGLTLTGAQVRTLLEQQWLGQPSPRILQASGVTYTWSAAAPAGSKVSNVRIQDVPLDPTASYRVAVNNFLASGGDNFTVLAKGIGQVGGPVDLDALVAWIESQPQPVAAPGLGRVVRLP
jgi:5'-nucleotidase